VYPLLQKLVQHVIALQWPSLLVPLFRPSAVTSQYHEAALGITYNACSYDKYLEAMIQRFQQQSREFFAEGIDPYCISRCLPNGLEDFLTASAASCSRTFPE
jgi:hypothetical protein